MAPCLEAYSFNKKVEFITLKQRNLLSASLRTCVCHHTSSIVEGGPLHWGGHSHRCIYMTEWTWPTSGNAHHPGRQRSQVWCACAVASSIAPLYTHHSSWAGRGGRSHTLHKTGGWALGLFVSGSTSSFAVVNRWRRGRDECHIPHNDGRWFFTGFNSKTNKSYDDEKKSNKLWCLSAASFYITADLSSFALQVSSFTLRGPKQGLREEDYF